MGEFFLEPSKEIFYDGLLIIISESDDDYNTDTILERTGRVDFKTLCGEYDDPISLEQIQLDYPDVKMVIYEEWLKGYVYRYGNHKVDGKKVWEKTGETYGFA